MNETLEEVLLNESLRVDRSTPQTGTKNPPFWKRLKNKCSRRGRKGKGCGDVPRDVEAKMDETPGSEDVILNEPPHMDQSSPATLPKKRSFWKCLKNKCSSHKKKGKVCCKVEQNVEVAHQVSNAFEEENVEPQMPEGLFEEENVEPQVISGSFEEKIVEPIKTIGSLKEKSLTDAKLKAYLDTHRHVLFEYFRCHQSVLCGYVHEKVPIEVLKSWLAAMKGSSLNHGGDDEDADHIKLPLSSLSQSENDERSSLDHSGDDEDTVPLKLPWSSLSQREDDESAVSLNSREFSQNDSEYETYSSEEFKLNDDEPAVIGKWEIISKIGEGGCGVVYKAKNINSGKEVVVKKAKYVAGLRGLLYEAQKMRSLHHKNILKLIRVHINPEVRRVVLILEYVDGVTLGNQVALWKTFTERQAWQIMEQLASAFAYMHSKNIVHRDIKLSNVLYSNGLVKVIDFGISQCFIHGEKIYGRAGTSRYMAPEISENGFEAPPIDVWALGVLFMTLFVGYKFDVRNIMEMTPDMTDYNVVFSPPPFASKTLVSLLAGMLRKDPLERLTMQEIVNHPFFEVHRQM